MMLKQEYLIRQGFARIENSSISVLTAVNEKLYFECYSGNAERIRQITVVLKSTAKFGLKERLDEHDVQLNKIYDALENMLHGKRRGETKENGVEKQGTDWL